MNTQPAIHFVITCKGRAQHLEQTLLQSIADNTDYPNAKFILLDYNSTDHLQEYLKSRCRREIETGKLVVYGFPAASTFHMAHAKNMASRCAIREGADILITLDADNWAGKGFASFAEGRMDRTGVFLCPDFPTIKSMAHGKGRPQRGYAGRLAIRVQEFIKIGGYDETFDTWRGEDIDMIARLQKTEYEMRLIDNRFLNAIPHNAEVRFKEYPHAQEYETQGEWKKIYSTPKTVVNFGKIGCGTVYRNFSDVPITIDPVPTRIFGIGMHKTATNSLHAAFKILGFDSFHWESNKKAGRIWNEMNNLGRSTMLEQSYALCDNPIPILYQKLDASYPGSKFVLTIRNENDWLKSVSGLFDPKINPHYDWDTQPYSHQIHTALYGRKDFDAAAFLASYRQHNVDVRAYFKDRPHDLLVLDMDKGEGWLELCNFLHMPFPSVPYPKAFVTEKK